VCVHILGTTHPIFTNFLVHVTHAGPDSAGGTPAPSLLVGH